MCAISKGNQGSILVGAVALSILMAIAGMGFLLVTANGINSETSAYENERAFQAAESGVWIAARWLRNNLNAGNTNTGPYANRPIVINNLNVYDTIVISNLSGPTIASINVTVHKIGSPSSSTFVKRIRVGNITGQNFGIYASFFDSYQPTQKVDWDNANNEWIDVASATGWNGWGTGRNFYGRVHFNTMPVKLFNADPRFYGFVTVAAGNPGLGAAYANGERGNNYSAGVVGYVNSVAGTSYTPTLAALNAIFTDRYIPNVNAIALNIVNNDAVTLAASYPADIISLPRDFRDQGYGPYQYRPTLYFNGSTARYYYRDAGGTYRVNNYNAFNNRIFVADANNNLNVYSSSTGVTGNVTVATATGRSIVPVGNLIVSGYNTSTSTITSPSTNNNMIGLVSGGYIAFNKTWIKRFNTGIDTTKYVSQLATGGGAIGPSDGVATLHITASIMAVCSFNDVLLYNGVNKTFPMKGTEWWDGLWDEYSPDPFTQPTFTQTGNKCEDYSLQLYGNHILGGYSRSIYTGSSGGTPYSYYRGCAGTQTYNHDPRMYQRNLQPPGYPGVENGTTPALLTLRMREWSVQNSL
jgi:hypothetical protein